MLVGTEYQYDRRYDSGRKALYIYSMLHKSNPDVRQKNPKNSNISPHVTMCFDCSGVSTEIWKYTYCSNDFFYLIIMELEGPCQKYMKKLQCLFQEIKIE